MSSRLDRTSDWEELAAECGYRVDDMARKCKVSPRQLQRHFLLLFGSTPKRWLDATRARAAAKEIAGGQLAKTASINLRFKQASHFTRFFKRLNGLTPKEYIDSGTMSEMDKECPKRITNVVKR